MSSILTQEAEHVVTRYVGFPKRSSSLLKRRCKWEKGERAKNAEPTRGPDANDRGIDCKVFGAEDLSYCSVLVSSN